MGQVKGIGNAVSLTDLQTITLGSTFSAADTITLSVTLAGSSKTVVLTIGSLVTLAQVCTSLVQAFSSISFTDTTATVTPVVGGQGITEFKEQAATTDGVTKVFLTGRTAGNTVPVFSIATSSGSGTVAIAHTRTATGPNDWNNTMNWDTGAVPVTGDDVILDRPISFTQGLAQSGVTLASLTITNRFNSASNIGLQVRNPIGYEEWRPTELAIGATAVTITTGSGIIKINYGTVQNASIVFSTGSASEIGRSACQLRGTHASNALTVLSLSANSNSADVGWGSNGETATLATLRQDAGTVTTGQNVTLTTITKNGGTLYTNGAFTTLTNLGDVYFYGVSTATTITHNGGTINDFTTSTWTTLNLNNSAVANFDGHVSAKTVTTLNQNDSTVIVNTAQRVTANGALLPKGRLALTAS